jgi:hypothetical protein
MKKLMLILFVFIGLLLASAYVFFPREINSSNIEKFNCNINSVNRFLMQENSWKKWWPGTIEHDSISGGNIFKYKGYNYTIVEKKYNALVVQTRGNQFSINGTIFFMPMTPDTVKAEWKYSLETTSNPIYKAHLYWETNRINENMIAIMKSMQSFLGKLENVYGIKIDQVIVKDTILVTTNFLSNQYPSTEKIYNYIKGIKTYISSHDAEETNSPMMHVLEDSGLYKTQIAIPVNKVISGNETYLIKKMVPGKILVTEIKGGEYTANHALTELGMYMSDYHLSSPAIPFQSLITNRMEVPDTSKWVTKIYYPVF